MLTSYLGSARMKSQLIESRSFEAVRIGSRKETPKVGIYNLHVDLTHANATLLELITDIGLHRGRHMVIGLAGPPGSGKSTLAAYIVDEINRYRDNTAIVLPMDGFHLSNSQLEKKGIAQIKGAPETFDVHGFILALSRIRSPVQGTWYVPDYSRVLDEPIAASIAITGETSVIVVEGNYLLLESGEWKNVRQYLDRAWFLDVGWDVCRDRLITRQIAGGKSLADASEWVDRSDKANFELVVNGSRTEGVCLIS